MYIYDRQLSGTQDRLEDFDIRKGPKGRRLRYVRIRERLGGVYLGPPFDRDKAVKANRQFRNTVGWKDYFERLKAFVGISQVEVDSEEALAVAVAEWQHK